MKAINIKANGREISVSENITILEALRENNIEVPTLHYMKGIVDIDESGICSVIANEQIVNASNKIVEDGLEIVTESPELKEIRKDALKSILSKHHYDCENCIRIHSCELKDLLHEYKIADEPSLDESDLKPINVSSPVFDHDPNKCVRCGRCVAVCGKIQGIGALSMVGSGLEAHIVPLGDAFTEGVGIGFVNCSNCGQCVSVCPVGALVEKSSTSKVYDAINDPEKFVVAQVAPSVRVALGEDFEFPIGVDVEGKIAAALRELGFDRVFDTKFGADLTIMEEANEFIERLENNGALPLMTSCCPGWVKYCEEYYPDFLPNVSSCKSPQQMFGAITKSYYAEKMNIPKENLVVVSIMPCTAKKFEINRPEMTDDVDISITTNELAQMIKASNIQLEALSNNEKYDDPLGHGTGAGVIFGASGGVMEAALRTAYVRLTGNVPENVEFQDVRGMEGVKECQYNINDKIINIAVVSGLSNVGKLLDRIRDGQVSYDFIEVMACPGGCINGGGQPHQSALTREKINVPGERAKALYRNDKNSSIRMSHENPDIITVYSEFLKRPGGECAHKLLHTTYTPR